MHIENDSIAGITVISPQSQTLLELNICSGFIFFCYYRIHPQCQDDKLNILCIVFATPSISLCQHYYEIWTMLLIFMYPLLWFYYCILCLTGQGRLMQQVMLTVGTVCCSCLPTCMFDQLFDCCRSWKQPVASF